MIGEKEERVEKRERERNRSYGVYLDGFPVGKIVVRRSEKECIQNIRGLTPEQRDNL